MPGEKSKITMEPGVKSNSPEIETVKKLMGNSGYSHIEGHMTPVEKYEMTFGAAKDKPNRGAATGMLDDPGYKVDSVEHTKAR